MHGGSGRNRFQSLLLLLLSCWRPRDGVREQLAWRGIWVILFHLGLVGRSCECLEEQPLSDPVVDE